MPDIPSIVDGPRLAVKKKVEYDIPCPKCNKEMRITNLKDGTPIKCNNCDNVTWSMPYVPPWWAKTSRFIFSILLSFILGFMASFLAAWVYEKYSESRNTGIKSEFPVIK
jgi:hypothetical protein